jgi:hypothetical protein
VDQRSWPAPQNGSLNAAFGQEPADFVRNRLLKWQYRCAYQLFKLSLRPLSRKEGMLGVIVGAAVYCK